MVNIVGDHATYHKRFDAPLESDIDALARTVSRWVRRPSRPEDVGPDAAEAVAAARRGRRRRHPDPAGRCQLGKRGSRGGSPSAPPCAPGGLTRSWPRRPPPSPGTSRRCCSSAARPCASRRSRAAARIGATTGARVLAETFPARLERGAGRPAFDRLGYFAEAAEAQLAGVRHLVLAGRRRRWPSSPTRTGPATWFLPAARSTCWPSRARTSPAPCWIWLTGVAGPAASGALSPPARARRTGLPAGAGGRSTADAIGAVVGASLPEGAVIVDEAITASLGLAAGTAGAPPHDWLGLTGGAIGQGLPAATGAAVASPGRRIVCVEADGSAMYTIQALWTQARESLDVTTIVVSNRAYGILQIEMHRVQADPPGPTAAALLDLTRPPSIRWLWPAVSGSRPSRPPPSRSWISRFGGRWPSPGRS